MPKRRSTIPIAHADDLPPFAFTDEQWQAIEHAYGRQLNADVRQQITTVTTQYLKDCGFERAAAPKEMALKHIKRVRRAAGNLEKMILGSKPFAASSDELSREQRQSAHSYAEALILRHLNEGGLANWDKLRHFRGALKSLVVACDCAMHDLSTAEYFGDEPWDWWVQGLTRIAAEHGLPYYARIVEPSEKLSSFVALVVALQERVPARHTHSKEALAQAIRRAQRRARDK